MEIVTLNTRLVSINTAVDDNPRFYKLHNSFCRKNRVFVAVSSLIKNYGNNPKEDIDKTVKDCFLHVRSEVVSGIRFSNTHKIGEAQNKLFSLTDDSFCTFMID